MERWWHVRYAECGQTGGFITITAGDRTEHPEQLHLEFSAFSRSGLITQLEVEGFTPAEAEYGVSTTGL